MISSVCASVKAIELAVNCSEHNAVNQILTVQRPVLVRRELVDHQLRSHRRRSVHDSRPSDRDISIGNGMSTWVPLT